MLGNVIMNLDVIRTKWAIYSKGLSIDNEKELNSVREAFEYAWREGYIEGHNLGNVIGIANSAIDRAMKYER